MAISKKMKKTVRYELFTGCQGNGLLLKSVTESETGVYSCYLDNFVQPIVSYKFSLMVEGTIHCIE